MTRSRLLSLPVAVLLLGLVALPVMAQCPPFLCYLDLGPNPGAICFNPDVYEVVSGPNPVVNPNCPANRWNSFVVKVTLPEGCSGLDVVVNYEGVPEDWTVNIGDSVGNNGFGGDGGELPAGQNAEVQVLDEDLSVFSAADNPADVDQLVTQHLALRDGALHFLVSNQALSWGQPYSAVQTPDLERLFFLPDDPETPANRDIYVAANQVISGTSRNGCGARRVLMTVR